MDQKVFRVVIHLRADNRLEVAELIHPIATNDCCEAVEVVEVKDGKIASVFDAVAGQEEEEQAPMFEGSRGDIVLFYNDGEPIRCKIVFRQGESTYGMTPIVDGDELHTNCIYKVHANQLMKCR